MKKLIQVTGLVDYCMLYDVIFPKIQMAFLGNLKLRIQDIHTIYIKLFTVKRRTQSKVGDALI